MDDAQIEHDTWKKNTTYSQRNSAASGWSGSYRESALGMKLHCWLSSLWKKARASCKAVLLENRPLKASQHCMPVRIQRFMWLLTATTAGSRKYGGLRYGFKKKNLQLVGVRMLTLEIMPLCSPRLREPVKKSWKPGAKQYLKDMSQIVPVD